MKGMVLVAFHTQINSGLELTILVVRNHMELICVVFFVCDAMLHFTNNNRYDEQKFEVR
jgi:hypothetical protein